MSTIEQETREAPQRPCLHGGYHQPGQCPEANAVTFTPLVLPVLTEVYTDSEAVDYVVGLFAGVDHETVDVAVPGRARQYLRLTSTDLVRSIDGVRRLLDQVEATVLDGRQDRRDASLVECIGCRTLIEPDENSCGSADCARMTAAERRVEASI